MRDKKLERIIEICVDAPLGHHADKLLAKKRAALEALDGPDVLLPIRTELTYPYAVLPNHGVSGGNTMFDVVRRVGPTSRGRTGIPGCWMRTPTGSLLPASPACGTV